MLTSWVVVGAVGPDAVGSTARAELGNLLFTLNTRYVTAWVTDVMAVFLCTSVFASIQDSTVPTWVRVLVGSVSILAAVISSLQTFLRYGMRAEGHRVAAIRYETLRRDMAAVLAIPRASRTEPLRQLNSVRERMDRYAKESPTIGEREWNRQERRFHLSKVPPDPHWARRTVQVPDADAATPVMEPAEGGADGR